MTASLAAIALGTQKAQAQTYTDSLRMEELQEVVVRGVKAQKGAPFAVENIKRKESASAEMFEEVCAAMRGLGDIAAASRKEMEYNPQAEMTIPGWLAEVA